MVLIFNATRYTIYVTYPKGASFNGRTAVSKTANVGSIPTAPAIIKKSGPVLLFLIIDAAGIESSDRIFLARKIRETVPRPYGRDGARRSRGRFLQLPQQ